MWGYIGICLLEKGLHLKIINEMKKKFYIGK